MLFRSVLLRARDVVARLAVEREGELARGLEVHVRGSAAEVDLACCEGGEDELVQAESGRAVHAGMFAKEAGLAILEDDHCDVVQAR